MSHTPGPWRMEEFRKGSYLVTARNAGTAREGIVAQHVPGIANARLIAAAPELLECLQHIQGIVSESQGVAGWHQNGKIASWDELGICEEVNAVLAKARGEVE